MRFASQPTRKVVLVLLFSMVSTGVVLSAETTNVTPQWTAESPRQEIRPDFDQQPGAGPEGDAILSIHHDSREGLDGYWQATLPISRGPYFQFRVLRKLRDVANARQSAMVRLRWLDAEGKGVLYDRKVVDFYRTRRDYSSAQPEWPHRERPLRDGWSEITGTYRVPEAAKNVEVRLYLKWAPGGTAHYSSPSIGSVDKPSSRIVRLATVHYQPRGGGSPEGNCRLFKPLIEKAAQQKADLVLLPETLTYYGLGKTYDQCAEPIPGPSTEYFGKLAKQHDMYIVAGLLERSQHLVYNVAVLIGPDGEVVGKYRKVCLPRGESEGGIAPGKGYPVFDTRFGKVGMMVCYDGFFPEVARELTKNGAEVIAWPVWGCNPLLAKARSTENHVYLMSSTYTGFGQNWIVSAVYDHQGKELAVAKEFGEVVVAEVDLDVPTLWSGLGDFKSEMYHRYPEPIKE